MDTFDFVRNKTMFSIKEKEKVSYRLEEGTYDPYVWQGLWQADSKMGPLTPDAWYPYPCVTLSPGAVGGPAAYL